MSIKASKPVIGAFVLGAVALLVVGVAIFGSGKLFSHSKEYVMYFDGSVKGLSVGAPVMFRGVKIGVVEDIILQGNLKDMTFTVPVIAEINEEQFRISMNGNADYHKALIDMGLRAQLQSQSLVTGQLMVDLDFRPNYPARFVKDSTDIPQIPTIPSAAEQIAQKLEELPIRHLVEKSDQLVGGLERLVNAPETRELPADLHRTVADTRRLIARLDREVGAIAVEARGAAGTANKVMGRVDRMLSFDEQAPGKLVENMNLTLSEARASLKTLDRTMEAVKSAATDERSLYQLRYALKDLSEAARSLGTLADYLDQHPEALLKGKSTTEAK